MFSQNLWLSHFQILHFSMQIICGLEDNLAQLAVLLALGHQAVRYIKLCLGCLSQRESNVLSISLSWHHHRADVDVSPAIDSAWLLRPWYTCPPYRGLGLCRWSDVGVVGACRMAGGTVRCVASRSATFTWTVTFATSTCGCSRTHAVRVDNASVVPPTCKGILSPSILSWRAVMDQFNNHFGRGTSHL